MKNPFDSKKHTGLTLWRRNPFVALQNELDRAMNEFYSAFNTPGHDLNTFEGFKINPLVDIVDNNDNFKVVVEMPGMGLEDVKVSIADGVLTIKGDKHTSKEDKDKSYLMREISYGHYERHIALPENVDIDKANASFKKGMLWVSIPKKAGITQHSREIEIHKKD